jgi:hypothetical protein
MPGIDLVSGVSSGLPKLYSVGNQNRMHFFLPLMKIALNTALLHLIQHENISDCVQVEGFEG